MVFNINFSEKGKEFMTNIYVTFLIFISGIIFAISYFVMDNVYTALLSVDCLIPQNVFFSTCQEMFAMVLYPILELKSVLIYANYFAIFGFVFALFFMGFRTKKHPALFIVHIISSIIIGYISIHVGNVYRTILSNDVMYSMLQPFGIYNKIMLYFPQFVFFIIFLSGVIGFIGVFKSAGQYNQGNEDLG